MTWRDVGGSQGSRLQFPGPMVSVAHMGTFSRSLKIYSPSDPAKCIELDALVDTGAFFTWMPRERLEALGYTPTGRRSFKIATDAVVERELCEARVALNGETCTTFCVFGDVGSTPLLGAYTLEGFALGVDPVRKELIHLPVLPAM